MMNDQQEPRKSFPQDTPLKSKDVPQVPAPLELRVRLLEVQYHDMKGRIDAVLKHLGLQVVALTEYKVYEVEKE